MKKTTLACLLFLIGLFIHVGAILAGDFGYDYDVSYTVDETGLTHVSQDIIITNKNTQYFAENYRLFLETEKVNEVRARDRFGELTPVVERNEGRTLITVPFTEKIVGINKTRSFTLEYILGDATEKRGKIWEILIPGIELHDDIMTYNVMLSVPDAFGKLAYSSPVSQKPMQWIKDEHQGKGITLAFGDQQIYSYTLTYHLENKTGKEETKEIALPPDTAFQTVSISDISEKPQNVRLDQDGNWLADFLVTSKSKKTIIVSGTIEVVVTPKENFGRELTSEERSLYIKPAKYWEHSDGIKKTASQLKTSREIYDFVVGTLEYSYEKVKPGLIRSGAAEALKNPKNAICMEYSDLFVAIARASGIPARSLHGFAYSTNPRLQPLSDTTDVLHAWVEYYDTDRKLWVPVDPTWADTTRGIDYFSKLDFNHIVLAILGGSSDIPLPAGSYRSSESAKDIEISFASDRGEMPKTTFETTVILPPSNIGGSKIQGTVRIKNTGQVSIPNQTISVKNSLQNEVMLQTKLIPPNAENEYPFTLKTQPQLSTAIADVMVTVGDQTYEEVVEILPFYYSFFVKLGVPLLFLGSIIGVIMYRKHTRGVI